MRKISLCLLQALFVFTYTNAQVPYNFAPVSGTYTPLVGGTQAVFEQANTQFSYHILAEGFSNNIPIGFTFNYNQTNYTQLHINVSGIASFTPFVRASNTSRPYSTSKSLANGPVVQVNNSPVTTVSIRPLLAPLWDDLEFEHSSSSTSATADITYLTTGSAPNRIFTVEWKNVYWNADADPNPYDGSISGPRQISFQIKLYETTNVVEFLYQQEIGNLSSPNALIGITTSNTGNDNFISVSADGATTSSTQGLQVTTKPATGQIFRFNPTYLLPVKLKDFIIAKQNTSNLLQWSTLSEVNNKGFQIQRSSDAVNFSNIAFVATKAAGGNSSTQLNYEYKDVQPLSGKNYYRLQQIDSDGKFSYSTVVMIDNNRILVFDVQKITPNPAHNEATLIIESSKTGKATLTVVDLYGKIVKQQSVQLASGVNIVNLNIEALTPAVYTIKVVANESSVTRKLIKQ